MIRLDQVHIAFTGEDILAGVTWHLKPGERVALVGRNGTGKTSLLRIMTGELTADGGTVKRRPGARIAYLSQHVVAGSRLTVWDEARSGMTKLAAMGEELASAQRAVDADKPGAVERFGEADEAFRMAGGFAQEEKIGEVLHGLGFGPDAWHRPCDTFSGGWQMRIALARLLLSDPDVALLDGPTNHLDLPTRTWLGGYLARKPWSMVVVSHDRHLVDQVATRIVEVRDRTVHHYKGNYSRFVQERDLRVQQHQVAYERQKAEIERLQRFVDRFGYKATKAAQANVRKKQLAKMERIDAPTSTRLARIRLPEPLPSALDDITLRAADLAWPESEPVLRGVDLVLERGMRLVLVGPNGCGKSTLLQALAGRLRPPAGLRIVGDRVRIGVFDQDTATSLPHDDTPVSWVQARVPQESEQRIRGVLGALGLSGSHALRMIGELSGGERARVALAAVTLRRANVLLLDEPTNHLDLETVEVLVDALSNWEGALVIASHDRWVLEQLGTHVATFSRGEVDFRVGLRPADLEVRSVERAARVKKVDTSWGDRKRLAREQERRARRSEAVQAEIEEVEAELVRLEDAQFEHAANYARAKALDADRQSAESRLETLFAEWEELEA